MHSSRISLDGEWDFLHVVEDYRARPVRWRTIRVPAPWQAQFSDLRMKAGTGLYRRDVVIPPGWREGGIYLRFGGVFHITRAWVNGILAGSHVGGFLPFSFDITDLLLDGSNEIKVRVDSPSDDPLLYPEAHFSEIPFGKQSWYGPLSGMWQSVQLERRAKSHLSRVRIDAQLASGKVSCRIFLSEPARAVQKVTAQAVASNGETVAQSEALVEAGASEAHIALQLDHVRPWSPDQPNLYRMLLFLSGEDGMVVDQLEDTFGFRTIEAKAGRLYLNGAPIYLRAALDQDYYPDTICTTPGTPFLEDQFRKAKELGLNCLRCHIKAPDPRYYEVADRLGLLIWTELPNMGVSTERSRKRKEETLKGIIDRDGNHPSIICWTIINENWGVDLVHDAKHREWLRRTYAWLKSYDPGRLVVDNSPLAPSFHVETDIADYHFYAALPDSRADWDHFVDQLASRPSWLFSPEQSAPKGDEPLICSEFGNWGLPDPDLLNDSLGAEPWWYETGHDWADGVMYPHGVQNRFADWSLGRVFGTMTAFAEAAQWQQFRALKYAIETMRAKQAIAGYVITEFTDAHWESNGLLDMRRNPRVFHTVFRHINADTVIIPEWKRWSYWSSESAAIELKVSHGAGRLLRGAAIYIALDRQQSIDLPQQAAGTTTSVGEVSIPLPTVTESCVRRIELELRDESEICIARNHLDIAIHPPRAAPSIPRAIWAPDVGRRIFLQRLGYEVVDQPGPDTLWICSEPADGASHVRSGGRMLLLPEIDCSLTPFFPHWQNVRVIGRDGTLWRGDWASTFSWLRRGQAFSRLPGGPLLDETFDRVLPAKIVVGCNLLDFQARVHGGMVIGWIHKPVATTVERGYGDGRIVVSTFRLFRDPPTADPTATMLLDSLVELALAEGSAAARDREEVLSELA
jgi:hypothetical protein